MSEQTIELAKQSDSTIIILIVVIVGAILALRPVIKMWIVSREKQQERLLTVIQANTEVNASLKTVLEENTKNCKDCKKEQMGKFKELQDNQDIANMKLVEIHTILKKEGVVNAN